MEGVKIEKCVGCGYCCLKSKCEAAVRLYPSAKICPQLTWSDENNRHYCGLMLIGGLVGAAYKKELYAGTGCSSSLCNSWRKDIKNRTQDQINSLEYMSPINQEFQVFLHCLGSEPFVSSDLLKLATSSFVRELQKLNYYDKPRAEKVGKIILSYIESNRQTLFKNFMG